MRVMIIGAGEVGFHLSRQLSEEGHDVVLIDRDAGRVESIQDMLDAAVIHGDGASPTLLARAGVRRADLFLAVTSQDETNLLACIAAAHQGVPVKIARVSRRDFVEHAGLLPLDRLGVDMVINPERECAAETYQLLQSAAATEFAQFEAGLVQMLGLRVRDGAPIAGIPLSQLRESSEVRFLVVAVVRDGEAVIPTGRFRIEAGDQIYVLGEPRDLPDVLPLAGQEGFALRRVIIAGGSDEALYLAQTLEEHRIGCTLFERDRARALVLAQELRRTLVLHGDATDLDLLELEGIGDADGYVAFTGSDETNLLTCLLAKSLGTRRVIALIERTGYAPLVARVGIDASVSPRISTVNAILRYVRRGTVLSVAALRGTDVEGIEFAVKSGLPFAGRPLAQVRLPRDTLIGAIIRGEEVVIPGGADSIEPGDRVILFARRHAIAEIEEIFSR